MGRLTLLTRKRVIELRHKHNKLSDLHRALLDEDTEVSRQSLSALLKKFDTYGTVADRPRAGRISTWALEHLDFLDESLSRNQELSARDMQSLMLRTYNITFSLSTVRRMRRRLGWVYSSTKYCQMVRHVNMPLRLAFCLNCMANDDDFSDIIFTDESSIAMMSSLTRCFRRKDEPKKLIGRPKHPLKVHVWAGISCRGATKICVFQGIMDTDFYINILQTHLLTFINAVYGDHHRFQQDNDPKHTARKTTEWLEENQINVWPFPAESPDLNPIENIWAALKHYIRKTVKPTTLDQLVRGIQDFWITVTPEMCQKYIGHLTKVMPVVVARGGNSSGF